MLRNEKVRFVLGTKQSKLPMPAQHTEKAFETAIELHLTKSGGYARGDNGAYDAKRALFPADVLAFIKKTQPAEWKQLADQQKDGAEKTLLDDLCRALDSEHEGCLSVLRHGFKCYGIAFRAAYFAPASGLNPETKKLYGANRLTITRQLRYSHKHGNTLDVTLALNGIPVATLELKNPMTGQTWRDAVAQYKEGPRRDRLDLSVQEARAGAFCGGHRRGAYVHAHSGEEVGLFAVQPRPQLRRRQPGRAGRIQDRIPVEDRCWNGTVSWTSSRALSTCRPKRKNWTRRR